MGIVKDGPGGYRVLIMAVFALDKGGESSGFPQSLKFHHPGTTALDTDRAIRPAYALKMSDALFLSIEFFEDFNERRGLVHG